MRSCNSTEQYLPMLDTFRCHQVCSEKISHCWESIDLCAVLDAHQTVRYLIPIITHEHRKSSTSPAPTQVAILNYIQRMGGPNITAPISRRKKGQSSPIGLVCAALSAVFAFGGTFILAMAMLTKNDSNDGAPVQRSALRQSSDAIINSNINTNELYPDTLGIEKPKPKGLIIHTHLGDIRIHFTPEWAGETSINYIIAVVEHASQNQNSGMGYNTADTMNGRRVTEGYQCEKCE